MKTSNNFPFIVLLIAAILFACSGKKGNHIDKSSVDQLDQAYPTLILLSAGLTTDTLISAFLNTLDRDPMMYSVAVVVNASTTNKKKYKKTKKIKTQFSEMGFDSTIVEQFDLMHRKHEELSAFDIIYILGGNPFLLLDELNKSGFRSVLKELVNQDKILMGYSAGSLLLGPDMMLMDRADSLLGFNDIGLKELTCLGLYDFYIFPHYADFTSQAPELIPIINEFEAETEYPLYRIKDNQGIIFHNGKVQIIGG